jgi:hypothetical protein
LRVHPDSVEPTATARPGDRRPPLWIAIAAFAVAGIALVALVVVVSYHSYSFEIVETGGFLLNSGSYNESFPVGTQVSGSWSTPTGVTVDFIISTPGGSPVFDGFGYSGSFSFTTEYSSYLFGASSSTLTNVSVSGTYWSP